MPVENETGEIAFQNNPPIFDGTGDMHHVLSILAFNDFGACGYAFSDANGSGKAYLGRPEDDVRIVDRQHGSVIRQAESKTAVGQTSFVSGHFLPQQQPDSGRPRLHRNDLTNKLRRDFQMSSDLHGRLLQRAIAATGAMML